MENKYLSKKKYIYTAYEASNGIIHIEKYPVVYLNKECVYFKKPGRVTLSMTYTYDVNDSFSANNICFWGNNKFCTMMFWDNNIDRNDIIIAINNAKIERMSQYDQIKARMKYETAKKNYERAKKEYEEITSYHRVSESS